MRHLISIAIAFLACMPHLHAQGNPAARRVALVIGNADYRNGPLRNPVNDARAMAASLRTFGFDVLLKENLRTREIGALYREFRTRITPGATALVFYAGHGVQVKGQNYFPSVDADIDTEEDVPLQSMNLGTLLENMEEAKAGVNLVFLDACRDNPFARRFRSGSRGLAKVEAASGTLIHYATKPGSVAADGDGANGTYTAALLREMDAPGMPVELMLKQVTNRVVARTKGRQEPWIEGSLRGDFVFNGQAAQAGMVSPSASDSSSNDRALWDAVRDSRSEAEMRAYLNQFPNGLFAGVAQARLQAIQSAPAQLASVAPNVAATRPVATPGSADSMAPGTVFRDCSDCPEMVAIPAGSFMMGESATRAIAIPRGFAVSRFEITFAQWDACAAGGGCTHKPPDNGWGRANRPVMNVNWHDAKQYATWLSGKSGKTYRLLTEAEWEYAARAGTTTAYYWGSDEADICQYASVRTGIFGASGCGSNQTSPVGQRKPNAFGLYDMLGNVAEWTEDCWQRSLDGLPSDGSARNGGNCDAHTPRGGSYLLNAGSSRAAERTPLAGDTRYSWLGIRVARFQ